MIPLSDGFVKYIIPMIRRLIRWLARTEIAKAREEGFEAGSLVQQFFRSGHSKLENELAYARGERAGVERAFDAVEEAVRERMGSSIELGDVAKARKGRLN